MLSRLPQVVVALLVLALAPCARAQERAPGENEQLSPPVLLQTASATYPEQARVAGLSGTVLLQLTIDTEGAVRDVEVLEPAGHGFDEAASEAALRLRFAPARRGEQPIAARIRYPFVFALPRPATAEAASPATAQGAPLADALAAEAGAAAPHPVAASAPESSSQELPPPPSSTTGAPVEVTVRGNVTEAVRLQQSAEAVNVVDTRAAKQQSADLGEVLARTQGVTVRRDGGLGSSARFSLNGLYDDQIRFFLDGVPLDFAGYPFGIVNVPVSLIERVEVYRGVVPIRFGADALGGAVNLVTDQTSETHLGASYQLGSFGTHRSTLDGRYRHEPTGLMIGAAGFVDVADNDYDVDVEIPDERGRLHPATVSRFHDGYRAYGATLEAGVVDRPWARRMTLQGFAATYDKELQHNTVMTLPYGEVSYGETVYGLTGRYDVALLANFELELVASYAHRTIDFVDKAKWVYDWKGERIRERRVAGEINADPSDQTLWQDGVFARALAKWTIAPEHSLRVSLTPQFVTRTGDERIQIDPDARDPLTAQRDLITFVSGLEYELSLFNGRLSNVVFVKDYLYRAESEEALPGGISRKRDSETHSQGFGDSLRFRFTPWLYAKASYEYATRLPRPDEVFGNGVLVLANLELKPEVSHNANAGPRVELRRTAIGDLTLDLNGFLRDSEQLIVLLGNDRFFTFQNVYRARALGLENALSWVSIGRWVTLDGTLTWQDVRNVSKEGTFAGFDGDRIPNRPYLFGSWAARLRFANLPGAQDALEPFYGGRYVHEFYRGWESQGLRELKQSVDAQVTHHLGVSWTIQRELARVTSTFEVDNATDAKLFDNFGVQRPGRAFYAKITGEI